MLRGVVTCSEVEHSPAILRILGSKKRMGAKALSLACMWENKVSSRPAYTG